MIVNIKKINKAATTPRYAMTGDAGMDLVATEMSHDESGNIIYKTGLAFEIPDGYVGLLFPRSSNSKTDLRLTNSVGVIDSGYRGEVMFKYRPTEHVGNMIHYNVGERVGQIIIIPHPKVEFNAVAELSETARGTGGYGSTGK